MGPVRRRILILFLGLLATLGLCAQAPLPVSMRASTWKAHLERDLLPFWTTPDALGAPEGNFPTLRTMSGRAVPGCHRLPRMMGRQVFAYCAGYLVTGDERLLVHARAGVDWLIEHGWDQENGGWHAELDALGHPTGSHPKFAQDMAYAAMGLGAYFFVTRDPRAEDYLKRTHDLMFDPKRFWDAPNQRILDGMDASLKREVEQAGGGWELVAMLDQINAYMLLAQPVLTDPADRERWGRDLVVLGQSIIRNFLKDGIFWGQKKFVGTGGRHVDFGHTLKTYWMLRLIDQRLGTRAFTELADREVPGWLKLAYDPQHGLWGESMNGRASANFGSPWWIYAECDQSAATQNLRDHSLMGVLERTEAGWLEHFVDRKYGEVYAGLQPDGRPGRDWPESSTSKVWDWKNGFHSCEHALVMYIHGLALERKPVSLYFAAADPGHFQATPYVFAGRETGRERLGTFSLGGRKLTKLRLDFRLGEGGPSDRP